MSAQDHVILPALEDWQRGIAVRDLDMIAGAFTPDALFQGLRPEPLFGRDGVKEYYESQPHSLTVEYDVLRFHALGEEAALAYLRAVFHREGLAPLPTHLTIVFERRQPYWLISHYHVSLA